MLVLDLALAATALTASAAMRPWRLVHGSGPPWPWLAWAVTMPLLWSADRFVAIELVQPLSGAGLMVLMCGWPLAVLAVAPVALAALWLGDLGWAQALHRAVWLGFVPMTLVLLLGAAVRRLLPHHLMVYILGRGFFATALAGALAGTLQALVVPPPASLSLGDVALARMLAAFGDAWICGMLAAIFVAFRPAWLATYSDRLYLPRDGPGAGPRDPG